MSCQRGRDARRSGCFRSRTTVRKSIVQVVLLAIGLVISPFQTLALAQQLLPGASAVVENARNPLDDRISFPLQPNFNFGCAPDRPKQYADHIQPNVPSHLPPDCIAFALPGLPR